MGVNPIETKIAEYKANHPSLAFFPNNLIISIMMNEGIITEQEVKGLPNLLSSSELPANEDAFLCRKQEEPKKVETKPADIETLLKDKDGKWTPDRLTKENLEKLFKDTPYSVEEDDYGIHVFDDKKNFLYSINKLGNDNISYTSTNGSKHELITFIKNKNGDYNVFFEKHTRLKSRISKETTYFQGNREVIFSKCDDDNNEKIQFWRIHKEDGKVQEIVKRGKFVFVKDLKNEIKPKIFSWLVSDNNDKQIGEISQVFGKYIHRLGLNEVLEEYKKRNHSDFFEDAFNSEEKNATVALRYVYDDIERKAKLILYKDEKEQVKEDNVMMTPLQKYKEKQIQEHEKFIKNFVQTLKKHIQDGDSHFVCRAVNIPGCQLLLKEYPDLIKDINEMECHDDDKKVILKTLLLEFSVIRDKECLKIAINSDLSYLLKGEHEDLAALMRTKDDKLKEEIFFDILRDINAEAITNNADQTTSTNTGVNRPINGKIDLDFKQGTMGNCWFLAALMGIKDKEGGQEYLDSLVSYNEQDNTVTVNLKGVNKQYVFRKDQIENNKLMSSGDGDIVALEMACDKYIKEKKDGNIYSDEFRIDSNGNWTKEAYEMLIGNGKLEIKAPDRKKFGVVVVSGKKQDYSKWEKIIDDFNNPKKLYSIAFNNNCYTEDNYSRKEDKFKWIDTETGTEEIIPFNHAISIKNMDDNWVYVRNPWDSKKVYKIKKEDLKILLPEIESSEIDFSAK